MCPTVRWSSETAPVDSNSKIVLKIVASEEFRLQVSIREHATACR